MNVKRFVAADMRRALELVKQEMGDDAIILSSKRIKSGVEILTSNDTPFEEARQASRTADTYSSYSAPSSYNITNQHHRRQKSSYSHGDLAHEDYDQVALDSDDSMSWNKSIAQTSVSNHSSASGNKLGSMSRGLASGKTQQQLAAEIDAARRKMEAAENVPFIQQEKQQARQFGMSKRIRGETDETVFSGTNSIHENLIANRAALEQKLEQQNFAENQYNQQHRQKQRANDQDEIGRELQRTPANKPFPEDQRIEPKITNASYDDLLLDRTAEIGSEKIVTEGFYAPFSLPTYSWTGPQTLSNFISYPVFEQTETVEPVVEEISENLFEEEEFEVDEKVDSQWQELKNELSDMREMLHIQLERLSSTEANRDNQSNTVSLSAAIRATIQRRLVNLGLTEKTAAKALQSIKVKSGLAETWTEVLANLAHQIPTWGQDIINRGGIYALVGPSGSGKTSTVSKLATRAVLEKGSNAISIVTLNPQPTDKQQLERLGKILGVTVIAVNDRISITRALADQCNDHLILIDTPSVRSGGTGPLNAESKNTLEILRRLPQVENMLVLPSNSQNKLLKASIDDFSILQPIACVLTKIDECLSLGESLNVIIEKQLPIAYSCNGPKIPMNIDRARGHQLVTKAVALLKKDQDLQQRNNRQRQHNIQQTEYQKHEFKYDRFQNERPLKNKVQNDHVQKKFVGTQTQQQNYLTKNQSGQQFRQQSLSASM